MKILVIGADSIKQLLWKSLLQDTTDFKVVTCNRQLDTQPKADYDLIISLSNSVNDQLTSKSINEKIPIICVVDDISKDEYVALLENEVTGIMNQNMSLESIHEAIQIVANGGIYINSPYNDVSTEIRTKKIY